MESNLHPFILSKALEVHRGAPLTIVRFLLPQVHLFTSSLSFLRLAFISQYR